MYKVKDSYYNGAKGEHVDTLETVDTAIVNALRKKDGYRFPERKSIEERIESNGNVIARLLDHLLQDRVLYPLLQLLYLDSPLSR